MAQLPKAARLLSDIVPMNVDDNDKADSDDDPLMKTPRKNLLPQFTDTQIDIGNERMKVYLRIRPLTKAEIDRQENQKCLEVESAQTVLAHAPKDSHSYRNTAHGLGKTTNKFTFSRIFKEDTSQKEFFKDTMLSSVKDFIDGQNCLVFSYGVTSSGKTYTIQGNPSDAGVLPRALDVLFNSISGKQWGHMNLKPAMFTDVIRLTEDEELREKKIKEKILRLSHEDDVDVMSLLGEDASDISQMTNTTTSSESSNVSSIQYGPKSSVINEEIFSDLKNRVREETAVSVEDQGQIRFSVWVSFAEIYNEQIFDLLEAIPKSKKARRTILKLSEDKNGSPYVKGLKQVHVESADEAYKLLVIGQRNLRTACTKLNHNSSRSHCIYNIKVLRVVDKGAPHVARVSMLSFCDLAGSERYSKTQNNGERLREAGNINTSLMTLGRCIETLRYNQTHKENKIIPFRDSKLTRLFQNFFNGTGRAAMIINISQCASLFDETIHVLKFSAIATKIIVTQKAEPPPKFHISSLSGSDDTRPSISWATPYTLAKSQFDMESAINMPLPEDDDEDLNESDDGVNSLLQLIEDLRQELVREKRSKVLLEAKIREEVCQEMMKQFVEIENNYSERIRFTEQRAEDMADRRIQIYLDAVNSDSQSKKQPEHVEDDDDEYVSGILLHREQAKVEALESKTKDLEAEIAELKSQLTDQNQQKSTMKASQLEQQQKDHSSNHYADIDQLKKQLAEAESTIQKLQSQIPKKAGKTTDYHMEKSLMAEKLEEAREQINSQQAEIKELNEMLTEAGETFENKETEISKLKELCQDYEEKLKTQARTIKALETAAEKSRNAMETADQSLSKREETLAKLQDEMQQLKDELKKMTNTCHFIEESLKEKSTEVETLKHKVQVQEESLKEKATEVETWKHKVQVQEESLKQKATEVETWKHKVQVQDESLKEKATEVETWKHKVQVQEESLKEKATEVETWKNKVQVQVDFLKEKATEVETWKHKVQVQEESLKQKATEVETWKHKVQVQEESLKEKATEVETWKHKVQVQEESLKEKATEVETWKNKVQVQVDFLKEKATEVETWKHKVQVQEESLKQKATEVETWKHKVQVQVDSLKEKATEVETWKHKFQVQEEESSKSEQALINGYKMEIANYKSQIHQFKVQLYGHGSKSPISKSPMAKSPLKSPSKTYAGMNTSLLVPDVEDTSFSHKEKAMKNLTQEVDHMSKELKRANEMIEILDQKAKFSKTEMCYRCEKEKEKGEQLKKDMEAKEGLLDHYKSKVEELDKNIQNINSLLSEKSAEIMKLMSKNEELETLNNGLKEMVNKTTLDLECKEKEIKLLSPKKCELDNLQGNDSPGSIASLQKKMKNMRHEAEKFQAVIAKHEEENKKLKSDLEKLKLAYRAKEEAVQELRNSVKEADFRVDEKEAEMMDLQEQLAQKEKTIKNLEGQLKLKEDDLVKTSEELVISIQDKERHYRKAEETLMLIRQKEEELVRLKERKCKAEKEVQTDTEKENIVVESQQTMERDTQTENDNEGDTDNGSWAETGKLRSVLEEKNKELELISDKLIIALQEKEEFASILRERRDSEEVTFCNWAQRNNEGVNEQGETCRQVGNAVREKDSYNHLEEDNNTFYKIKEQEKDLDVREKKLLDKEQVVYNIEEHLRKQVKEVQDREVKNKEKEEELMIKDKKIKDAESDLLTEKEKLNLKETELHDQERLLLEEKEKLVIVRKELEHLQEELEAKKNDLDSAEQKFEIRVKDIAAKEKDSLEENKNALSKKEQEIRVQEKDLDVREKKILDKEQMLCTIEEHLRKQEKDVQEREVKTSEKEEELGIKAKEIKDTASALFTEKENLTLKETQFHDQEKLSLDEKEKLVCVRKELEHLQEELETKKNNLDSAEKKFEIRVKDIATKEKDIETKRKHMIEKEAELTEKEAELDKKEEQLMDEDCRISERGNQIEKKEACLEKLATDLKEKEKFVKQREAQLDEREKMLSPKEVEFEDKRKELCNLEEELSVIKSEFEKQEAELASRKKEICNKEVELEKKSQMLGEREVLIKQREDSIKKKLSDKMNLENEQLKSKDNELISKLEEIKKLEESIIELKTYERQVDEKITEIKMKDEELNNLELKYESLEIEMKKMEEKTKTFEDLQVSFKELKHELEEKEKEISKLRDARMELAEVKCAAHTHKTLYEKVKQEYLEARKELEKLTGLEKCVSEKETALKEAKNTVNALSSELSDLKEKLQQSLTQKETLEKETERLQSQLFATGDVEKMKEELEMTKTRLNETLTKLLENETKLREAESKVKELDEQNKKMADELCDKIPDGSSPEKGARHYRKEKIQMQNSLIEYKVKIESLQTKIRDFECRIESEKLQRSTACVVPSAGDPSLLNKIQKLSAELMEKDSANRSLIKEVAQLKDKIEELEVKLKEAYSSTPQRKGLPVSAVVASPTLSHELDQSHEREQKLRCQLRQASQTIQELNSQISGLRDEIRSKETSDTTDHDTIKSLQDKWNKAEEKLREKHQEELRQLQEELVLREQKILTKSAIVKSLREQIKTERDKFEIFATDKKNNDEVLQQVKEALKVQESMLKDYDNALQSKEEEITVKQTEYEKLQEKYHELLKSTGKSDKELLAQNRSFTKVEAERDLLLKHNLELQDEIKKITNEKDRLNSMIRENNNELKGMEQSLTETKLQHEELKQKMLSQSSFEISVMKKEQDKKYHDLENKLKEKTEYARELQSNLRRQEERLKNTEKDLQHKEDTIKAWKEERDKLVSGLEMILKKQIEEIKQLKEERDFALRELQRKGVNQEEQATENEEETSRSCHKEQVKQQNIKDDERTNQRTQKIKVEKVDDEDGISEKINTTVDRSTSTSAVRRTSSKNNRKRHSPVITPVQEPPASKRVIRESDISVTSSEDISGHLQIDATPPVAAKNLKRNKRKYASSTNLSNQPNEEEKSEDEKGERPQRKAKKTARGKIGSIVNSFRESSLPRTARRILHSIVEASSPLSPTSPKKEDSSESVKKSNKKSKNTGSKENISSNVTPSVECLDPPEKNSQQATTRRRHKLYKDETYISEPMECGQFVKSQDNEVHKVETRRTRGRKGKVTDI